MKAILGVIALLLVLAIVGTLAKKQLEAVSPGSSARNAAAAGSTPGFAADPNASTVAEQAKSMQERARANTTHALEQGAQRNQRAEP
jgi:hypothetical protein